jgi:gamma-glutamyl-gamma-aminobutyrate hydrolase PuuD
MQKSLSVQKPLVLWGGVDICPSIYNEVPGKWTQKPDKDRDYREITAVNEYINEGLPVVGVCRGAQLLCAINGGTLYQHTEPLRQNHSIETKDGNLFAPVTAGHHQVMSPKGDFILYGWNPSLIKVFRENGDYFHVQNSAEVVYWPKTKCLAIQPHPEWAKENDPFVYWINKLMKELEIDYAF